MEEEEDVCFAKPWVCPGCRIRFAKRDELDGHLANSAGCNLDAYIFTHTALAIYPPQEEKEF